MDTLQAAVVLGKLEHFDDEVAARARIGARYTAALSDLVTTPAVAEGNTHVYAQYSIQVDDRAAFVEALKAQGIPTAVHYPVPLHRQKAFAPLGYSVGDFPISEAVAERIVSLPMGPFLSDDDQNRVIAAVRRAVVG
jgi:UDP-2-acetamido-2-deoxy-ribo-hexuluronate aminotransferase